MPDATTPPFTKRVVVIGGGAAGALTAVHLLREAAPEPIEVALLDRGGGFGPGVAYATTSPLHLLNVPACRMGGIAGCPDHFLEWLRGRGEDVDPAAFVARGRFGSYLVDLLDAAAAAGPGRLVRRRGDAVGVTRPPAAGSPLAVELDTGERLEADHVVLAVGPLQAAAPFPVAPDLPPGAYVGDPWAPGALAAAAATGGSVLIVGSGLTMVDVALSLAGAPDPPSLRAVSRHGLLPRRHRTRLTRTDCFREPAVDGGLDSLLAAFFAEVARAGETGGEWRDVIDSMRPFGPALWRQLRDEEKRRFLVTLHRPWDVHRFRMAPAIATRLGELCGAGGLRVEAGTVRELVAAGDRVEAVIEADGRRESLVVDQVVNCAGAGTDISRQAPPPIAGMLADGTARADPLGLGLDVDPEGALIDANGHPSTRIHVVGALRLGVDWETIGVTEIRDQAGKVARRVLGSG